MKSVKVAVLRARHDPAFTPIPDQACIEMVVTNVRHTSVLNYWEAVTDGHLNFAGSALFPWVDIEIGADDVSRETQCARAVAAARALPGSNIDDFDLVMVFSYPGQIVIPNPLFGQPGELFAKVKDLDGGAGPVVDGKPACAIPIMTSNHTFMCHELGHALGWNHSYGILNNGIDWDGKAPFTQGTVYGDPYDIMSSASFGSRWLDPAVTHYSGNPDFTGPTVDGWPNPGAFGMGPAPARAHLHLWDPQAPKASRVAHHTIPAVGQSLRFTLSGAGAPGGDVELAVLHPQGEDADGRGRCYIEYRQQVGWDRGLELVGRDLSRQAVVVHTLADTDEGVRCWYRGRVLVPLEVDADVTIAGTPLSVTVENVDMDAMTVDIAVTVGANRGIDIHARGADEIVTVIDPQMMTTPCGDPITYGTYITLTNRSYRPVSYGFGGAGAPDADPLVVRWTVAGVAIDDAASGGSLDVPTAEGVFTLLYENDLITRELTLSSRGGEKYRLDVSVAISEADGSGTTMATAPFSATGFYEGYGPGDRGKLDRCMQKYAKSARLRLRDHLIPPGPEPDGLNLSDRVNRARMAQLIAQVAEQDRGAASALSALNVMRFGLKQH